MFNFIFPFRLGINSSFLKEKIVLVFVVFSLFSVSGSAQSDLIYNDYIYKNSIKTPMCYQEGDLLSAPFIELGVGKLKVRFDDLSDEIKDYYYTVIHCDFYWNPSDLDQSDYLTGFYENTITESEGSFNTQTDYIHYQFTFPNDMAGLKISGNYLLLVYQDGDQENLVLSRRFVVFEQKVYVNAHVKEATAIADSRYRQEVDVKVNHKDYSIDNPYSDFHLAILQNNRWDNAIVDLKPRFVKASELDYDYSEENVFDGGNEFREFDLTNLKYITNQVAKIELLDGKWYCWLRTDPNRAYKLYTSNKDINGNFYIVNKEGFEQHVEEDYVDVFFHLQSAKLPGDVYVFGKLTDFSCLESCKMNYDEENKLYQARLNVKQGYYNYIYVVKQKDDLVPTMALTEGNHFETENSYTIIAYNTDFVAGYDRVVGINLTDSNNK